MSLAKAYAGVKPTNPDRKENDYYPTAPVATYSLIAMEDELTERGFPTNVWEPAAGRGWMSFELERCGVKTVSTDLFGYEDPIVPVESGVDFLNAWDSRAPAIVTNPPYKNKLADKFMTKCLRLEDCEYFALLVRLTFMESQGRLPTFQQSPPTRVYPFAKRFNCDDDYLASGKQFGGMIAYAWFVWDYRDGKTTQTNMHWIDTQKMYVQREAEIHDITTRS